MTVSLPISGVCFVVQLDSRHAPVGRRKIQRALLNPVLHRCVESRLHHPPCGADNAARRPRGRTQPPFIVSVAALLPPVYESVQLPDSVRIRYIQEAPYLNDHRFHGCLGLCAFQLAKGAACSCLQSYESVQPCIMVCSTPDALQILGARAYWVSGGRRTTTAKRRTIT